MRKPKRETVRIPLTALSSLGMASTKMIAYCPPPGISFGTVIRYGTSLRCPGSTEYLVSFTYSPASFLNVIQRLTIVCEFWFEKFGLYCSLVTEYGLTYTLKSYASVQVLSTLKVKSLVSPALRVGRLSTGEIWIRMAGLSVLSLALTIILFWQNRA